jgi:uncharacterized membrane protein YciS (DUF1049 family)
VKGPGSPHGPGRAADRNLIRELGVRQVAALIFNYIVGAGIFVLPALAATRLGPAAVLAYLVCAGIAALMVLCFAEAGSRVASHRRSIRVRRSGVWLLRGVPRRLSHLLSGVGAAGAVSASSRRRCSRWLASPPPRRVPS